MTEPIRVSALPCPAAQAKPEPEFFEDEFVSLHELSASMKDAAWRTLKRTLAEMEELIGERRWEDLIALFHPVEEKCPELVQCGVDAGPRARIAFAMGHVKRFDEAIHQLHTCLEKEPDSFVFHSAMGYTAYNSLYAAKNREIFLSGKVRAERIELAHRHFDRAEALRSDGVTCFYRRGMLYRQIERKTDKALPYFQKAVANWDALSEEDRQVRHQERKNFVKALYQLAGSLLEAGFPKRALDTLNRCIQEDAERNHISLLYKYFALGKVHFHLNAFAEARDALLFALKTADPHDPIDFVCELLGRVYLAMKDPEKALKAIERVPEKRRRPYCRWTEADILCALGRLESAKKVLTQAQERDTRSRHKSLLRLARIEYLLGRFGKGYEYAADAAGFFREKWGGIYNDGLFWQALCAFRLGDAEKAQELTSLIRANNPRYPRLDLLIRKVNDARLSAVNNPKPGGMAPVHG